MSEQPAEKELREAAETAQYLGWDVDDITLSDWILQLERRARAASARLSAPASATQDEENFRIAHARRQGNADGFQIGWHAALSRVREGDSLKELSELVPAPPVSGHGEAEP